MNSLEKSILENLKNSLIDSALKDFNYGDVEEWAELAKRMQTTINTSVSVMEAMLNEPTKEDI